MFPCRRNSALTHITWCRVNTCKHHNSDSLHPKLNICLWNYENVAQSQSIMGTFWIFFCIYYWSVSALSDITDTHTHTHTYFLTLKCHRYSTYKWTHTHIQPYSAHTAVRYICMTTQPHSYMHIVYISNHTHTLHTEVHVVQYLHVCVCINAHTGPVHSEWCVWLEQNDCGDSCWLSSIKLCNKAHCVWECWRPCPPQWSTACVCVSVCVCAKLSTCSQWCIAPGDYIYHIRTFACICVCLNQCLRVSVSTWACSCMLHSSGLQWFWGLARRGREFLQIWTETEEGLTGDSKLLQTLDGGSDNLQFKWAATEGDSVSGGNGTARISPSNWWCWRPVQRSEPGEIVLSQVHFELLHWSFLSGRLRLLSQKTVLSFETVLYVAPWCQQHH